MPADLLLINNHGPYYNPGGGEGSGGGCFRPPMHRFVDELNRLHVGTDGSFCQDVCGVEGPPQGGESRGSSTGSDEASSLEVFDGTAPLVGEEGLTLRRPPSMNDTDEEEMGGLGVVVGSSKGGKSVNMTECVSVPSSEHVAEIVGRQGCKIKALRAKTNTYIKTPVRGEQPMFVVTGRLEDVAIAKREILAAADHFSQIRASRRTTSTTATSCSPSSSTSSSSPGGGATPPRLTTQQPPPVDSPPCTASMNTQGVGVVGGGGGGAGGGSGCGGGGYGVGPQVTVEVRVPFRVVGLVVGPRGATVKRIQQDTGTYIVTPGRDRDPVFEIIGSADNVDRARKEIESYIALRTTTTHCPPPPTATSYLPSHFPSPSGGSGGSGAFLPPSGLLNASASGLNNSWSNLNHIVNGRNPPTSHRDGFPSSPVPTSGSIFSPPSVEDRLFSGLQRAGMCFPSGGGCRGGAGAAPGGGRPFSLDAADLIERCSRGLGGSQPPVFHRSSFNVDTAMEGEENGLNGSGGFGRLYGSRMQGANPLGPHNPFQSSLWSSTADATASLAALLASANGGSPSILPETNGCSPKLTDLEGNCFNVPQSRYSYQGSGDVTGVCSNSENIELSPSSLDFPVSNSPKDHRKSSPSVLRQAGTEECGSRPGCGTERISVGGYDHCGTKPYVTDDDDLNNVFNKMLSAITGGGGREGRLGGGGDGLGRGGGDWPPCCVFGHSSASCSCSACRLMFAVNTNSTPGLPSATGSVVIR